MRIAGAKACRGFSVAELIISILVISIILAAFTPLITQKARNSLTVRTNVTKGLEIYTNPGTYAFDVPLGINTLFIQGAGGGGGGAGATSEEKEVSITTSTNWIVPSGVYQLTLSIIGSGGGGGGSNGNSTGTTSCEYNPGTGGNPSSSLLSQYPLYKIVRGSNTGSDLCMFKRNALDYGTWPYDHTVTIKKAGETCTSEKCCWYASTKDTGVGNSDYIYSYKGNKRAVCKLSAAKQICSSYGSINHVSYGYRLPQKSELSIVDKFINEFSVNAGESGLQLCGHNYKSNKVPQCMIGDTCIGADALNRCQAMGLWSYEGNVVAYWAGGGTYNTSWGYPTSGEAYSVRCVKDLNYYNPYSGAGGASGAILEKTISVLPKDVLEITIGNGGNGGAAKTKGSQGETTTIVHKRNNIELGTYYVKGGLGGNAATTSAHGTAYTNGTANNETTPTGTCYARNRNTTTGTFNGGNINCSIISNSGESGASTQGGNGGTVDNTITIEKGDASSGGYLYIDSARTAFQRATDKEISLAKGQNATSYGFGGGGGFTPIWANSTNNFYQGGKGAQGKVVIKYNIALPGGGGGSGSRIGGVNNDNNMYEIKYKVDEGSRIVFIVGSGGSGGTISQNGFNGAATIIGDNDIVFLAGEGGKIATESDKALSQGGQGGKAGYINENGDEESTTSGIKLKTPSSIEYTYTPTDGSFKGQNGKRGGVPTTSDIQDGYSILGTIFEYGFSGGIGGSPFGVADNKLDAAITCGGGIYGTLGESTNINYICTTGNVSGNSARSHDPVNNEYGGSGGGGGGFTEKSSQQGKGGNGSNGYLRVRWDATQQN